MPAFLLEVTSLKKIRQAHGAMDTVTAGAVPANFTASAMMV
jgi:hypothetical protein